MDGTTPSLPPWLRRWGLVLPALLAMYVPTYVDVSSAFWSAPGGLQGPVILLLVLWLIWRERRVLMIEAPSDRMVVPGALLLTAGLILYVPGRSQFVPQLDVGSQIFVLLGLTCLLAGRRALQRLVVPIGMLAFLIPVPGSILEAILLPLKQLVSAVVDNSLHLAGYPIARTGVVLMIGQYNLLIADACSGLNSIVALTGIGLICVQVAGHRSGWRRAVLLLAALPIALGANLLRVVALVLITFYSGEDAGQTFHDQAGLLEVALAMGAFLGLNRLLAERPA